jgi:hypothetical protein
MASLPPDQVLLSLKVSERPVWEWAQKECAA